MSDRLPDLDFLKVERADKRKNLSAAFVEEF